MKHEESCARKLCKKVVLGSGIVILSSMWHNQIELEIVVKLWTALPGERCHPLFYKF